MKKSKKRKKENEQFPIVGIGASAGGLKAITSFFEKMPADSNIAFVIIQHLDPKHESIMDSILNRYTTMTIEIIHEGMEVKPNCVYLNPPDKNVSIQNRIFHLSPITKILGITITIDNFFRSLAIDLSEKAICIILSGTGADGSLGLKEIKSAGGMTIAQDIKQAEFSSMPINAIKTGLVDFELVVEEMPAEIIKYIHHPYIKSTVNKNIDNSPTNVIKFIISAIKKHTGHDFSKYKYNTIIRRIEHRMAVHKINVMTEYYNYIKTYKDEINILFKNILIGVTSFFRDTDAFNSLKEQIFNKLKDKASNEQFRIWIPGCSTGEEVYSIAIIIEECMEVLDKYFDFQIFATDLDDFSIEIARKGIYKENILTSVSEEQIKKYFSYEDNLFKVKKTNKGKNYIFSAKFN